MVYQPINQEYSRPTKPIDRSPFDKVLGVHQSFIQRYRKHKN